MDVQLHYSQASYRWATRLTAQLSQFYFDKSEDKEKYTFYDLNLVFGSIAGLPTYSRAAVAENGRIYLISDTYTGADIC